MVNWCLVDCYSGRGWLIVDNCLAIWVVSYGWEMMFKHGRSWLIGVHGWLIMPILDDGLWCWGFASPPGRGCGKSYQPAKLIGAFASRLTCRPGRWRKLSNPPGVWMTVCQGVGTCNYGQHIRIGWFHPCTCYRLDMNHQRHSEGSAGQPKTWPGNRGLP